MRGRADVIVEQCIGSELRAPLRDRPLFRGTHECATNTLAPGLRLDVPALQVRHAIRHAALRVFPDRELGKTNGCTGIVERKQDVQGLT